MKKNILFICLYLICFSVFSQKTSHSISLNKDWEFAEDLTDDWQPAVVPGTIHQDLIRLNKLPDPFYGTNEKLVQWVEDKDWCYRTSFFVEPEQMNHDDILLCFEGLDTYAEVFLNGALILQTDNMFVAHEVSFKPFLRSGENRLYIRFYSAVNKVLPLWESNGFDYPADNDHHDKRTSVFTRKAPYHYGWDWGIRLVGCGIWRPVHLSFIDKVKIDNHYIKQNKVDKNSAEVDHQITLWSYDKQNVKLEITYTLEGKTVLQNEKTFALDSGANLIQTQLTINRPQLWMPNGWGKAWLYNVSVELKDMDGTLLTRKEERVGLRSIRVINEIDADGRSFYFEVNGEPLFAKGSNYIPQDIILTNVDKARYDKLFKDIKSANMNMIRVWGGGIYEDDYFYRLADENGILIWQDFMFGCTSYPADDNFLKSVAKEAEYNIKRLRNHACLAIWCGNNEVYEAIKYWGWHKKYDSVIYNKFFEDYDKLFRKLLPDQVAKFDPDRFYLHSSPDSANWGRPHSLGYGDSHYWGVWYGHEPFEILFERVPRFMSEFGFQSFPEMKTLQTFSGPADYDLESEVMRAHQKSSTGNKTIKTYMDMYYKEPADFEAFVYQNLIMQGEGMYAGIIAHRLNRPYCMGSLYWQLNDSWPVVSWSSIDYYGNWKALHYKAREAFKPIITACIENGDSLEIYAISDQLEALKSCRLELMTKDFYGKIIDKSAVVIDIAANTTSLVHKIKHPAKDTAQRQELFTDVTLKNPKGEILFQDIVYYSHPKDLNLPPASVKQKIKYGDGVYELTVSSKNLVKQVFIEVPVHGASFSDNFFDLRPGEKRKIVISAPELKKSVPASVQIRWLNN